ncbi:hypothetical protein HanHA89_Chr12g0479131 [Helianthus annuus]|nr:hypothetical protein HanHA89_Chr12g0479131 [Helianthus annuus]
MSKLDPVPVPNRFGTGRYRAHPYSVCCCHITIFALKNHKGTTI